MFQSVRPNSQVYLFHKTDNPYVEIGFIASTPVVRPKFPQQMGILNHSQETVVDLTVKVDGMTYNFPGLPANLEIADTFSNGENVVISISRDAINAEIMSLKQKADDAVNSYEKNKALSSKCDALLQKINPEYAEKQEQQTKIDALTQRVDQLTDAVSKLVGTLSPKPE